MTGLNRDLHPTTRRALNLTLAGFAMAAALYFFWAYLQATGLPARPRLFGDATTYLAAAERLAAGQDLYRLTEPDPRLLFIPGVSESPLLSPPPIAALWRVLAIVPFGFQLWMVACWIASFGAIAYLVVRAPLPAAPLAIALSLPLGEQVFGGNACCFYPLGYAAMWRFRDHPAIGVVLAAMAAVKLAPIAMAGWLIGTRRFRALGVTIVALGAFFVLGGLGAGFESYLEFLGMAQGVGASPMSASGITGVSWASYGVLVGGSLCAIGLGWRWPASSFALALLASILGTPALWPGHLAALLALAAPFVDRAVLDRIGPAPTLGKPARAVSRP